MACELLAFATAANGEEPSAGVAQKLAQVRGIGFCPVAPTEDSVRPIVFQGRPALEIKAREREDAVAGKVRELAILDVAAGRIVTFVCFANTSTRQAGEAIISLSEISTCADRLARSVFPGASFDLDSIHRYRASGQESVYYEARYTPAQPEFPYLESPVRLLLNATTGSLFRLDIDPDGLAPVAAPRSRISRQMAERIASVVLREHDLGPGLGAGAVFDRVGGAELFVVRPNGWLGIHDPAAAERNTVAWVVPVQISGGAAPGVHSLFIDAASGRVLGGREAPR